MTSDILKPAYKQKPVEIFRGSVEALLQLKQNYVFKKVMHLAKRFRDEDDLDCNESA